MLSKPVTVCQEGLSIFIHIRLDKTFSFLACIMVAIIWEKKKRERGGGGGGGGEKQNVRWEKIEK